MTEVTMALFRSRLLSGVESMVSRQTFSTPEPGYGRAWRFFGCDIMWAGRDPSMTGRLERHGCRPGNRAKLDAIHVEGPSF